MARRASYRVMTENRVAALIGDFYHEAAPMRVALETAARGPAPSIDFFTDPAAVPWDRLSQYSPLVMAREGHIAPLESRAVWNTDADPAYLRFLARGIQWAMGRL